MCCVFPYQSLRSVVFMLHCEPTKSTEFAMIPKLGQKTIDHEVEALSMMACMVYTANVSDWRDMIYQEGINFLVILFLPRLFEMLVVFLLRTYFDQKSKKTRGDRVCRSATLDITIAICKRTIGLMIIFLLECDLQSSGIYYHIRHSSFAADSRWHPPQYRTLFGRMDSSLGGYDDGGRDSVLLHFLVC